MVEVPAAVDASGLICPQPPERLEAGWAFRPLRVRAGPSPAPQFLHGDNPIGQWPSHDCRGQAHRAAFAGALGVAGTPPRFRLASWRLVGIVMPIVCGGRQ